jgi:hypothetical protein
MSRDYISCDFFLGLFFMVQLSKNKKKHTKTRSATCPYVHSAWLIVDEACSKEARIQGD